MQLRNSKTAKMLTGLTGVAMAFSLSFGTVVAPASAATADELQAQIASLLATITSLQSQLNTVKGGTTTSTVASFARDLQVGSNGADVKALQVLLNKSADTVVATTGAGSAGNETMTFGPATKAAVKKFQTKNGITPVSGFVGPKTRAVLNAMGGTVSTGTGTGTTVTPMGSGLTVTAGTQPAMGLLPPLASRVPFTRVNLTASADGDVVVNGITVERTGAAQDSVFNGVVLIDENGTQIGVAKTLNSNHQVTVGEPFTVKAGTTKMVTIAGNGASAAVLANLAGQVASLTVVGVNTSATVNGSLPITGTSQVVNATLSVGTVQLASSSFDPATTQRKEIGTTGYKFSGLRITAGSAEKVRLYSIRWNQSGSASSNDLANIKVNVDGTDYPTTVSTDGKYYTAIFGSGIVIDKGFSKDAYISGDIVGSGAASRTVKFDIYKNTDIYLSGETYGYGVTPTATAASAPSQVTDGSASYFSGTGSNTTYAAGTPMFYGAAAVINAGSATSIGKATSVAAGNVAVNVPNQVLGGFETDFKGEPISVQTMSFSVASTSVNGGQLTNVSIYDENGSVVAGPVDASGTSYMTLSFTDTVTFPVGKKVYTVKGKLPSTGFTNNDTITLSTDPTTWTNILGQTTGNSISFSSLSSFSMNAMTVRAASLAVSVSATPAVTTIVAGGQARTFANYQFDATQSGEDIRFSSLPLALDGSDNALEGPANKLSSCQLFDGATALNTGSNVVNPTGTATTTSPTSYTFTLDSSFTVPKNTVKTLTLKCNVSGSVANNSVYQWGMTATTLSSTGVTSSNDITEVVATSNGQAMTVGVGAVVASTDASSPSYALAAANTTNNVVGVYKLRASNEAVNLTRLGLTLTNTASSSAADLAQVTIWDGSTQVGSATFTGASTNATATLSSVVSLPKNVDKILTIKADLTDQGTDRASAAGHLVAIDINTNGTNTQGTGVDSGLTINASGSTAVGGVRVFQGYPTVAEDATLTTGGIADGTLMKFKVTANSGPISLAKFSLTVATTTASATGLNIYAYTDSGYSVPVSGLSSDGRMMANNVTTWASSATQLDFSAQDSLAASTTIQIPAGATRYFAVKGSVSNASSGAAITTTLLGDAAFPQLAGFVSTFVGINNEAGLNNDFIWSPNTAGSVTTGSSDWTNGFGVVGLPSSGLTKTRSAI